MVSQRVKIELKDPSKKVFWSLETGAEFIPWVGSGIVTKDMVLYFKNGDKTSGWIMAGALTISLLSDAAFSSIPILGVPMKAAGALASKGLSKVAAKYAPKIVKAALKGVEESSVVVGGKIVKRSSVDLAETAAARIPEEVLSRAEEKLLPTAVSSIDKVIENGGSETIAIKVAAKEVAGDVEEEVPYCLR